MEADSGRASELRALKGSRSRAVQRLRRLDALAWGLLALSLLISAWYAYDAWLQARKTAQARYEARAEAIATALSTHMQAYEDLVRASAGVVEARPQIRQAEFLAYAKKLQLPQRHAGVHGLGFARRVATADLEEYQARQREQHGEGFRVHPQSTADERMVLDLLYPDVPGMHGLLGMDVAAEPKRRAALLAARDSGELSAAAHVRLNDQARGEAGMPGFLLYVPVYMGDTPTDVAARRRQLLGFTTAGFGWEWVMQAAVADEEPFDLQLRSLDPDVGLVYERHDLRDHYGAHMRPAFTFERQLEFLGGQWRLSLTSAPWQAAIPELASSLLLAAAGIALGLLAFALLRSLARADRRSRALLDAVADHLPALIAYIDREGRYGFANRASRDWFDDPAGWSERSLAEVHAQQPEFLAALEQAMQQCADGRSVAWETRIGKQARAVQVYVVPDREPDQQISGWYLMAYDINQQQEALRELALARDHLQRVTDKLPALIEQYDRDECAVFFNRASEDIRWSQPYSPGIHIRELIGEELYARRKPYLNAVMSGRDIDFETVMITRDGRQRRMHTYYTPDVDEYGDVCGFFSMSTDITEKLHLESALHAAHQRAEVTLTSISDAVITSDVQARITYMNPAAEALCGWPLSQAMGLPLDQVAVLERIGEEAVETLQGTAMVGDIQLIRHDGKRILVEQSISPLRDRDATMVGSVIVLRDITEARALSARMTYLAHHDALTGLPNRMQLNATLGKLIEATGTGGESLAVLFIDLDLFKHVNDALGHHIGDQLLQQVARRIQRNLGSQGSVYRTGGDEFVVLLDKIISREQVAHVAERLLTVGELPYTVASHELHQAFSIGISVYPDDGHDASTLMMRADAAMYLAKRSGRNASRFHNVELAGHADARIALENSLRRGLRQNELCLHYQPQVDACSGRIVGVEALLRWQRGERLMMPGEFLPIAEETHLIVDIDRWALLAACRQNRIWQQAGLPPLRVSVNVAAANFDSGKLVETVAAALDESGMEARYLELEVTETTIMQDVQRTDRTLRTLKAMGVRIAIDDFGTGFSSLSYLGNYGFNVLKIDQSFVREVTDPSQAAITRAIISLASQLDCRTIAEGVETQAQLEWLVENGCDELQGHLFSPPLPAADFAKLLARGASWPIPRTRSTQTHWS